MTSTLDDITTALQDVPYMKAERAEMLAGFMAEHDLYDVLEIGTFKGKSAAYFAAIMEAAGKGHLTTIDRVHALDLKPNVKETLERVGLSHRVTPVFADRSHTWEMGRMIQQEPLPQFDMCYFDGGHTWDVTGFGFFLVDILLKPGGWIILDDMSWTMANSIKGKPGREKKYAEYGEDEMKTPAVKMVFNTLLPTRGYVNMERRGNMGFAQKPG